MRNTKAIRIAKAMRLICTCKRCGHEWVSKGSEVPTRCAACKSPYWQKERAK